MDVNLFTEKNEKTAVNINLVLHNFRIEYSNDLVKNLAEIMLTYNNASQLGEFAIAPNPDAFERKIELWTPWYLIRQAFFINEFDPHGVRNSVTTEKYIEEETKRLAAENGPTKMKETQRSIARLDKSLKLLDVKLKILIEGLYLSLNTNYNHKRYQQNRNLLQMRTEPFEIILIKHGRKFGLSVLGVQIMSQSSFELLFQFVLQMQKAFSIFTEHPALKDGKKYYEDIVHSRIYENNRKTKSGSNNTFGRLDASTIRRTGGDFSFSTNPRLSAIGSYKGGPGDSTFGLGTLKSLINPPRNTSTIDFNTIKHLQKPSQTARNYTNTERVGVKKQPRSKVKYQFQEEEFNEDESFNDTDEDLGNRRVKVRNSGEKGAHKAMTHPQASLGPSKNQEYIDQMKEIERRTINEFQEPNYAPRAGPSRLARQPAEQRRYVSKIFHKK